MDKNNGWKVGDLVLIRLCDFVGDLWGMILLIWYEFCGYVMCVCIGYVL